MSTVVWEGAEQLRPFLVAIEELEPWPGNPRQGNVAQVRQSLARFGQVRPVLVDGRRIVAGHHVVEAAREEGWTHVAVIENTFESEDEARAYLLADNRLPELGGYDDELLAAQLRAIQESSTSLEGTGYSNDDFDATLARLRRMATETSPIDDGDKREHRDPNVKELVLLYDSDRLKDVELWAATIGRERGIEGLSEIVYQTLRRDASSL